MRTFISISTGLLLSIASAGCSREKKLFNVEGTVVFEDGSPAKVLLGGHVSFESVADHSNGAGEILDGGRFRLTAPNGANGVPAGRYRVLVMPAEPKDPDHPPPSVVPDRYRSYEHSGIEVAVEEKANNIQIKVRRN